MSVSHSKRYLETQVMTASREQLLLMLYDGGIRLCEQGAEAFEQKQFEQAHEALLRAQRVVIELWCALNPEVDPELARSLGGLYSFVYLRLVHANVTRDAAALGEAVSLLKTLRQAWGEAVEKARTETRKGTADTASVNP